MRVCILILTCVLPALAPLRATEPVPESAIFGGPGNFELEDPTVWMQGGRYQVLCTDWESKATGIRKCIVPYSSGDGVNYELVSQVPMWSQHEPLPLVGGKSMKVAGIERPQIFLNDRGDPAALLVFAYPAVKESEPTFITIRPLNPSVSSMNRN